MLHRVSFMINGLSCTSITIPYVKELLDDLEKNNISISFLTSTSDLQCCKEYTGTLMITDSMDGMNAADSKGLPCIVYTPNMEETFCYQTAYMLIEGFDEIDSAFLIRIYQRAQGIPLIIAQTPRCLIRETTKDDITFLAKLHQIPSVLEFTEPLESTKEGIEEALRCYISTQYRFYEFGLWTVTELATGNVIGRCGLENRWINNKEVIMLSYIITPSSQNTGIGTECVSGILSYGFHTLHLKEIIACIDDSNLASIALALCCGLQKDGTATYGNKYYSIYRITNPIKEKKRIQSVRKKVLQQYKPSSEQMVYKNRYSSGISQDNKQKGETQ